MYVEELKEREEMAKYLAKYDVSERISRGYYASAAYAREDEAYLAEEYASFAINIAEQYIKARKKDNKFKIIETYYGLLSA